MTPFLRIWRGGGGGGGGSDTTIHKSFLAGIIVLSMVALARCGFPTLERILLCQ